MSTAEFGLTTEEYYHDYHDHFHQFLTIKLCEIVLVKLAFPKKTEFLPFPIKMHIRLLFLIGMTVNQGIQATNLKAHLQIKATSS